SFNCSLYSLAVCNVISLPKKRCPYVLSPVLTPAISNGITSELYKATSQRIGRAYRIDPVPHRIVFGKERPSITLLNEGSNSVVSLPIIFFFTKTYEAPFTSFT